MKFMMRAAIPSARSLPLLTALAIAAAVATGCKGDPPTPPPEGASLSGSFRLESVGGNGLPYNFYCFGTSCETLISARVETMSQTQLRDIMVYRPGPGAQPITDTIISSFAVDGQRVILSRSPAGGSISTYADTGEMDASGRFFYKPQVIQGRSNQGSRIFLYVKE